MNAAGYERCRTWLREKTLRNFDFMPQTIAKILVRGHGRLDTRARKGKFYIYVVCTVFSSVV